MTEQMTLVEFMEAVRRAQRTGEQIVLPKEEEDEEE